MKAEFYYWLTRLAYKMCQHYDKRFNKCSARHTKWLNKWEKCYITGGGADNADPD